MWDPLHSDTVSVMMKESALSAQISRAENLDELGKGLLIKLSDIVFLRMVLKSLMDASIAPDDRETENTCKV